MRVLVDTNIVLDFLLQREPFFQDADLLFQVIDTGQVVGHVTATTLTDIFGVVKCKDDPNHRGLENTLITRLSLCCNSSFIF